jgi:hypothetical protein
LSAEGTRRDVNADVGRDTTPPDAVQGRAIRIQLVGRCLSCNSRARPQTIVDGIDPETVGINEIGMIRKRTNIWVWVIACTALIFNDRSSSTIAQATSSDYARDGINGQPTI